MDEHRLALMPGYQIEHFRIESVLGKGGFGITYAAMDLQLGKRVAIKELLPDSIATRIDGSTVVPQSQSLQENWMWARDRFLEEARLLAGFSHPAIVGVHRLIEANGTIYMVMDFVDGESYEARLRRHGCEKDEEALLLVINPLLEGLSEIHSSGILHRDIKPDNILINRHGQPILIDFGSARQAVGATMTMTSIVTHGYSPIEQYQTKGRMGPWTDIYALGAVMCRAITGEKPPVAADRLMDDEFIWMSNRGLGGFSDGVCNWVDWALRIRPEERPKSIPTWTQSFSETAEKPRDFPPPVPEWKGPLLFVPESANPGIESFEPVSSQPDSAGVALIPPTLPVSHWPLSSGSKRAGAVVLDITAAIVLGIFLNSLLNTPSAESLAVFGPLLYFIGRDCFSGKSPGRLLLGLQVRRVKDQQPISFLYAIWRNAIPFLFLCGLGLLAAFVGWITNPEIAVAIFSPLFFGLIAFYVSFGKNERRTLLDKITGTVVVDLRKK